MDVVVASASDVRVPEGFRLRVEERADSEARMYLRGREEDNPVVSEMKDLIDGVISPEYSGRTVLELLQNGHDAHDSSRDDGQLQVVLDETDGQYGTLYAVNGGAPLDDRNFKRMTGTGRSSKRPDNSIGNKGIGFKSVNELSAVPEVYSADTEGNPGLAGYRFRFATPADFDEIARRVAPNEPELADELRDKVSHLRVSVPLTGALPARVEQFAAQSVSTVIRLPLRSHEALQSARSQIREIESSEVPFHLFLERVSLISLQTISPEESRETLLIRDQAEVPWANLLHSHDVSVCEIQLGDNHGYVVASHNVPEDVFRDAIKQSCAAGQLNTNWLGWKGPAKVSVAFPMHHDLDTGHLYTYLPMGPQAVAPLPALVNAPFASRADRRTLSESVAVNAVLLEAVAKVSAALLAAGATEDAPIPAELLVDAASWTQTPDRLENALKAKSLNLWEIPFIPTIGDPTRKAGLDTAYHWDFQGLELTPHSVAATKKVNVIDPALSEVRIQHLSQLCKTHGWPLDPPPEVLAECIEAVALQLADNSAVVDRWADFYDDLARLDLNSSFLEGRTFLLDETGELARAGKVSDGPQVYFAPRQTDDSAGSLPLPAALRTRLVFASPAVPDREDARHAGLRPGREWLARQGLVSEYRTENILNAVASTMKELSAEWGTHDADLRECLKFAFELTKRATRDIKNQALESLELFVPVSSGWVCASAARFDAGWDGPEAHVDAALERLVLTAGKQSSELADVAGQLVPGPGKMLPGLDAKDHGQLRMFLEALGVMHGLWPVEVGRPRPQRGRVLASPRYSVIDGDLPLAGFTLEVWRSLAQRWTGHGPSQTTTTYAPQSNWFVLPGQADFEMLDEEAQRIYSELVVLGLGCWPSAALEVRFCRPSDMRGVAWPTPLAAFLSDSAWVPQATPGDRSTITRSKPSQSWWLAEADTVDFLPSQPARFRVVDTDLFHQRLRLLGVRIWDDPATAQQRLDHLAVLVRDGGLAARTALSVRRAVEFAWSDLITGRSMVMVPETLVVQSQGALAVTTTRAEDAGPIYVIDIDDVRQQRLLEASPLLVLPIKDFRLGKRVLDYLRQYGARVRSIADAQMSVLVDGVPVEVAQRRPLLSERRGWLTILAAAAMELKYRGFPPLPPKAVAVAIDRLDRAHLVVGQRISVRIDGHLLRKSGPTSLVVSDDASDVLVVDSGEDGNQWQMFDTAADSIAQLIGAPSLGDTLRVAFTALCATGLHDNPVDDVARALRLDPNEVRAVVHEPFAGIDTSATVFVLMCLEPSVGYELHQAEGAFIDEASLREWLADRLAGGVAQANHIMQLSLETDRGSILIQLDADLPTLNAHLRKVQLAELENAEAQSHQYRAYLQEHGASLRDQLRDRFTDIARRGGDLSNYVQLGKQIPTVAPDRDWVTDFWMLDPDLMAGHVMTWLDAVAPATPQQSTGLPSVDETRADAQRRLRAVLGRLPALMAAWTHKNHETSALRAIDVPEIVEAITATGRLDFGPLESSEIVDWLRESDRWPAAMPPYATTLDLDITVSDLEKARERIKTQEAEDLQATTTVVYKDEIFTAEHEQMHRLFEEVRSSSLDEAISTPPVPVVLALTPMDTPVPRRNNTRPTSWQASGPAKERTKLIGLIGETIVGRWIEQQFGLAPTDTWMSGYRQAMYMDDIGNDSLGYDYRVETPDRTLLLEVKASLGDDTLIQLGESEVRKAQDLTPDEEYMIVFVTNVDDSTQARIHPLPNPFAPGGLQRYRVVGQSMSLRFDLDGSVT